MAQVTWGLTKRQEESAVAIGGREIWAARVEIDEEPGGEDWQRHAGGGETKRI